MMQASVSAAAVRSRSFGAVRATRAHPGAEEFNSATRSTNFQERSIAGAAIEVLDRGVHLAGADLLKP